MKRILCFLFLALPLWAANYTVKAGGGGNYTTIQACATAAVAGDTCTIFAGTYTENVSVSHNGTLLSPITFVNNTGDSPSVWRFYITGNYITVQGLTFTDTSFVGRTITGLNTGAAIEIRGSQTGGSIGVQLLNNTIAQDGYIAGAGGVPSTATSGAPCIAISGLNNGVHYATIKGNTLSWCSALSAQSAASTYTVAGTATLTSGSSTLTGVGTAFTTDGIQVGDWLWVGTTSGNAMRVLTITDDTHISLSNTTYAPNSCTSGSPCLYKGTTTTGTLYGVTGVGNGNPNIAYCINIQGTSSTSVTNDHILISNNDCSHTNDFTTVGANVQYAVYQNNTWHDISIGPSEAPYSGEASPASYDSVACNELTNCNNHEEFSYFSNNSGYAQKNILYEGNTLKNIWGHLGSHGFFSGGGTGLTTNVIQRFNVGYHVNSCWMCGFYASTLNWKTYNDTLVNLSLQTTDTAQGVSSCGGNNSSTSPPGGNTYVGTGAAYLNVLHYNALRPLGQASSSYYTWYTGAGISTCPSVNSKNNLLFDSSCSPSTKANCVNNSSSSFTDTGNTWADPKMAATDGSSFYVQAGSPALAAGASLTTVTSGCPANTPPYNLVFDASYFQDGWGITGVIPDTLSFTTVGNTANIGSINYATNTVTFAGPVTCTNNDPVWLHNKSDGVNVLTGVAPNIGALGAAPVAPYTTTATCLGSANGTIACTNNPGAGYTCPVPAISATCTAGVASGQTTQLAADGDIPKFTATGSFIAWLSTCTGVSNPCTASAIHANGNITAQFSTLPTVTVTIPAASQYCNPVNGCSLTYTATIANCNVAGCVWSVLDYPSGAILTDVTTGQLAYCAYGITVNALCGDGTHPSGTFSIRRTITDFSQGTSAQAIGNVFIPPNVLVQTSPVLVGFGSFVAPGGSWLTF